MAELNRMNVKRDILEMKLLVAPTVGAAARLLPEHRHDAGVVTVCTIEEIQLRAETVTPLLRKIPEYEPPPRWGINE